MTEQVHDWSEQARDLPSMQERARQRLDRADGLDQVRNPREVPDAHIHLWPALQLG